MRQAAMGMLCFFMACAGVFAQGHEFRVPSGNLKAALDAFVAQTGAQLVYRAEDVRDVETKGVNGALSDEAALSQILEGTHLKMRRDNGSNALVLYRDQTQSAVVPPADAASSTGRLESVVITGTRIKSANLVSSSPMTIVDGRELRAQGATNVEDMLNRMPQLTASQSQSQSTYGTSGTATLNLRNLGPQRTLVLIDGQRLVPGDPIFPYPDVNFIPSSLVSSIDIVTGGASAVYGSDAVAGVVNFKMKRNFEGVQVDILGSGALHDNDNGTAQAALSSKGFAIPGNKSDGSSAGFSIIAGRNFADERGNVTLYATHNHTNPVTDGARDWAACGIGTVSGAAALDTHACQGSGNSAFGRFRTNGSGTGYANNPNGSAGFVPYSSSTMGYNSNELSYLQRRDDRSTGGLFAHLEIAPALDLYTDVMLMRDRTKAQISPSGLVSGHTYSINCDNPLLTAAQASTLCGANAGSATARWSGTIGYRFSDGGMPRIDDLVHNDSRFVLGARGKLDEHWSYDVSAQYSQVLYSEAYANDFSVSRIQNALLVKNVGGVAKCQAAIDGTDPNCVPLNIFQLGQASSAYPYLNEPSYKNGAVRERIVSAALTGDLGRWNVQSPYAATPVGLAVGSEFRKDSIGLSYSDNLVSGDLSASGTSSRPAQGSISVKDIYTEVSLPLIDDKPGIKHLVIDAGYRWSDYNLAGKTNAYKLNLSFTPVDDVTLRGGYNRAVRAPNVTELFSPVVIGSASGNDPCAGTNPTASLAKCQNSGVTAAQYGTIPDCSSGFCNVQSGGNRALKPETADTYTAGLVFTPTTMKEFTATLDYFDIKVKKIIGTVPSSLTLSQCLNGADPYYCGLIHRNAAGSIAGDGGYVVGTNQNTGYQKVSGLDFGANYRLKLDRVGLVNAGTLTFGFLGTWLQSQRVQSTPGQNAYDCAGLYGPTCGVPSPRWRQNVRLSWNTPWDGSVSLNWRYIAASRLDANSGNPTLAAAGGGIYNIADARIKAYSYFDLSGSVMLRKNITLRMGINNLFDKDPPILDNYNFPIITAVGNGNTYSGLYDTLGRVVYTSLSVGF